ncbi:MAG: glycosyl hydrolase-related protein [Promethearchaeota archaeon]
MNSRHSKTEKVNGTPTEGGYKVHLMPHQHFDHAWYEPVDKCHAVAGKNLRDALLTMRADPDFTFVLDQGVLVESFARNFPHFLPELKKRVREGRVGLAGGMVTMPDSVLPCGESQIRNIVHGKRFFWDLFGVEVVDGWMLDVFGQTMQIPQFFAKAGLRSTTFFRGFDYTRPHVLDFRWAAPDGTEILAHVFPGTALNMGYTTFVAPSSLFAIIFSSADRARAPLYTELLNFYTRLPHEKLRAFVSTWKKVNQNAGQTIIRDLMLLDGSDFTKPLPSLPAVARFVAKKARRKFRLEFSTPRCFFDAVEARRDALPVREGEFMRPQVILQGTYSTRPLTKKLIRRLEHSLYRAELVATLAHELLGAEYPRDELDAAWHALFENDFHDIVCGCNSDIVYLESTRQLKSVIESVSDITRKGEEELTSWIKLPDGPEHFLWVFNALPWPVGGNVRVQVPGDFPGASSARGVTCRLGGRAIPAEIELDEDGPSIHVLFPRIRGIGWTCCSLEFDERGEATAEAPSWNPVRVEDDKDGVIILENEFYRLEFSGNAWVECLDKDAGVNLIPPGTRDFGRLVVNPERGDTYFNVIKYKTIEPREVVISVTRRSPLSATVEIREVFRRRHKTSTASTRVTLTAGEKRVDIKIRLTNRFKRVAYRLALPFNLQAHTAEVRTGVPAGHAVRANGRSPIVRWATLNGRVAVGTTNPTRIGVALLDEGIPAREFRGGVAYYTLLRSVGVLGKVFGMPFPAAFPYGTKGAYEQGTYSFHCGFSSDPGTYPPEKAAREGWEFNVPLSARIVQRDGKEDENAGARTLPDTYEFMSLDDSSENFVFLAVKEAEGRVVADRSVGSGVVVRALETSGQPTPGPLKVEFDPGLGVKDARVLNFLEELEGRASIQQQEVVVESNPQEIHTLGLETAHSPGRASDSR